MGDTRSEFNFEQYYIVTKKGHNVELMTKQYIDKTLYMHAPTVTIPPHNTHATNGGLYLNGTNQGIPTAIPTH